MKLGIVFTVGAILAACAPTQQTPQEALMWNTLSGEAPLIIAHRGASGYLPEHTLEAYALAIDQGADVIEPDLVFTKDGILVARHDRYLSTTTDVSDHPEFANRKHLDAFDHGDGARARIDWWVEDFTLAELKTLRARQPFPGRSKEFDDQYEIPTFDEILNLVTSDAKDSNRPVGIYPETKSPGYFESISHDFENPLLAALQRFEAGPVFIQSFEPDILKRLKGKTDAKLVQLISEETPGAGPNIPLKEIAEYADGVGPSKNLVLAKGGNITGFLGEAHKHALTVHPWTFRNDQRNTNMVLRVKTTIRLGDSAIPFDEAEPEKQEEPVLMGDLEPSPQEQAKDELHIFFTHGVDGVFTDFPDTAVGVRETMQSNRSAHSGESRNPE